MTRKPDESALEWLVRASRDNDEAQADLAGHRKRLGLGDGSPGGSRSLVHDHDYDAAYERAGKADADRMVAERMVELEAMRPPRRDQPRVVSDQDVVDDVIRRFDERRGERG